MIKNRAELEKFHGHGARIVLAALEAGLKSVEPGALVRRAVRHGKKNLVIKGIGGRTLELDDFGDIYVVGAGKATAAMADALCKIGGRCDPGHMLSLDNDIIIAKAVKFAEFYGDHRCF